MDLVGLTRKPRKDKRLLPPIVITEKGREICKFLQNYFSKQNDDNEDNENDNNNEDK